MKSNSPIRVWQDHAISLLRLDAELSPETGLLSFAVPFFDDAAIHFYFKDESTHSTGSLKHRLARSLFLYGIASGWIHENTTIIEASSGSTAISEAYFAQRLNLPFIAVMHKNTSLEKVTEVRNYGGSCHFVENPADVYICAENLAKETQGHYMDQFTFAERVTDWRGTNNIAQSLFEQVIKENHSAPRWVVVGAGTGGTSSTIGRFITYHCHATQLCVADPEGSVFSDYFKTRNLAITSLGSRIEGIGRPRPEPSFIPSVIDRVQVVQDKDSIAAMLILSEQFGKKVGPSTGTNFVAMLDLAAELKAKGEQGAIASLLCDSGERYLNTYHNSNWVNREFGDISPNILKLKAVMGLSYASI